MCGCVWGRCVCVCVCMHTEDFEILPCKLYDNKTKSHKPDLRGVTHYAEQKWKVCLKGEKRHSSYKWRLTAANGGYSFHAWLTAAVFDSDPGRLDDLQGKLMTSIKMPPGMFSTILRFTGYFWLWPDQRSLLLYNQGIWRRVCAAMQISMLLHISLIGFLLLQKTSYNLHTCFNRFNPSFLLPFSSTCALHQCSSVGGTQSFAHRVLNRALNPRQMTTLSAALMMGCRKISSRLWGQAAAAASLRPLTNTAGLTHSQQSAGANIW